MFFVCDRLCARQRALWEHQVVETQQAHKTREGIDSSITFDETGAPTKRETEPLAAQGRVKDVDVETSAADKEIRKSAGDRSSTVSTMKVTDVPGPLLAAIGGPVSQMPYQTWRRPQWPRRADANVTRAAHTQSTVSHTKSRRGMLRRSAG